MVVYEFELNCKITNQFYYITDIEIICDIFLLKQYKLK